MPKPIIIDCDPGIDDAFLLAMAAASDEIEIVGVTTTYGNVGLDHTTNNALRVLDWLGNSAPVYAGVDRALLSRRVDAAAYHGASGLEAPQIGPPKRAREAEGAISFLTRTLLASAGRVTIIASGPMTNLAIALRLEPGIAEKIEQVVFMGGSTDYGNDSPAAEFNFLCDPHAAQIVLDSGVKTVMFGLNVTHQVVATPAEVTRLRSLGNESGTVFADMAEFFARLYTQRYGFVGSALHDPCTVAWLIDPDIFEMREMRVDIDTDSGISFGRSVHDIWGLNGRPHNSLVALNADSGRFFNLLRQLLSRLR